jgi:hypothetical protein
MGVWEVLKMSIKSFADGTKDVIEIFPSKGILTLLLTARNIVEMEKKN